MNTQKIVPLYKTQTETTIEEFIESLEKTEDLQASTIKEYQGDLKNYLNWLKETGRQEPIQDTTINTITSYRDHMQKEKNHKPATINRRLNTLKKLYEWIQKQGRANQNPAKAIRLIPEEQTSPRQVTNKEAAALARAASQSGNLRDLTIILLMLHAGPRTMEVCDLKPEDVHLGPKSGYLVIRSGKRKKRRNIPLNSTARAALKNYLATHEPKEYLFPSQKTGSRLSERGIRFMIQKHAKTAKLENISAHDLRHRFGYEMAKKVPLHHLAQIMGHDSLDTTKIYVQATLADLQEDVEKINWQ